MKGNKTIQRRLTVDRPGSAFPPPMSEWQPTNAHCSTLVTAFAFSHSMGLKLLRFSCSEMA
ncbi:hypothetical protein IF2G_09949 [Cordyceps javanica]|nr:hypothetical protein IF2G_09949 [Cordyceps javanica]